MTQTDQQSTSDEDNTEEYLIFEHKEGEECEDSLSGGRTYPKEGTNVDKDDTFGCSGIKCDGGELVYQRTIEISETLSEPNAKQKELIDDLSDYEKELYLGMVMESMRGSWTDPKPRLRIIKYLCESGINAHLSDEFLQRGKNRAENMYKRLKLPHKHIDGRSFRGNHDGCYGKLWNEVEKDLETMRELSDHIPDDLTWRDFKFERLANEQEAEENE